MGYPRGPRLNFGSGNLVRWTLPGPPDGVYFSNFFNAKFIRFFVGFLDAFLGDCASMLEAKMHPKWGQKWKMCVFSFERLV